MQTLKIKFNFMHNLDKNIQKFIAIFIAISLVLSLYFIIVHPIKSMYESSSYKIDRHKYMLGRLQQEADLLKRHLPLAKSNNQQQLKQDFFIYADKNLEIIQAQIQKKIKLFVLQNGSQFRSARFLPLKDNKQIKLIGVRVELQGNIDSIKKIIYQIENAKPYLIIQALNLKPFSNSINSHKHSLLTAQFDVYGILWSDPNVQS